MSDHVCTACKKGRPTFAVARAALFTFLRGLGWDIHEKDRNHKTLKVPYAVAPGHGPEFRLWFKPQAVWYSGPGNSHSLGVARSTHDDIRDFTPSEFLRRMSDYTGGR